jgi:hypothetical protein
MFDLDIGGETIEAAASIMALAQLEQNKESSESFRRRHDRVTTRAKVSIQPGSSSERYRLKIHGVTTDISRGGCRVLFSAPVGVGDVYWMVFDQEAIDVDPVFVRCVRCRLVREDTFDTGFSFFTKVDVDAALATPDNDLL